MSASETLDSQFVVRVGNGGLCNAYATNDTKYCCLYTSTLVSPSLAAEISSSVTMGCKKNITPRQKRRCRALTSISHDVEYSGNRKEAHEHTGRDTGTVTTDMSPDQMFGNSVFAHTGKT